MTRARTVAWALAALSAGWLDPFDLGALAAELFDTGVPALGTTTPS